jgi:lipoprotein LprG
MTRSARAAAAALLSMGLLFPGCSSGGPESGPLPRGPALLRRAALAMADVRSGRFSLRVQGVIGGFAVRRADGVMTRDGSASGTVELEQGDSLVELDVVYVGGTIYVRGPTGPFQRIPESLAGTVYDPTDLLDPSSGLVRLLRTAGGANTEAREDVGGESAYRVTVTLDGAVLGPLVPNPVPEQVPSALWIGADEPLLLQVTTQLPKSGSVPATQISLSISEPNLEVHVTPPAEGSGG